MLVRPYRQCLPACVHNACALQVMFTAELQRRLPATAGVLCFSLHPGEIMTGIVRGPLEAAYRKFCKFILYTASEGSP